MSSTMRRWILASALVGVLLASALAAACGDASHIFEGRFYLEARDCLGTTGSVDVVEGDPPGVCPPVCLADAHTDGGRSLYVSTMCAPYPFGYDASGGDPACPRALAALGRDDTCRPDGTSTHALDAGSD